MVLGWRFFAAQVGLLWWWMMSVDEHVQKADLSALVRASALCSPDLWFGRGVGLS